LSESLLLVHGAGSGPGVFDPWADVFPKASLEAVDLQAGLDPTCASMHDYAQAVCAAAQPLRQPIWLFGWSMGGLVALMASQHLALDQLVLLEPSPPAEVQGSAPHARLRKGTFDPEEAYGSFPPAVSSRPESQCARDERKRGISIPSISCSCLVVYGDEFSEERGRKVAHFYGAQELYVPGATHWDLVLKRSVRNHIRRALSGK
jgi:pimeloyl-ACP methyl ester carboxylesterase